MSQIKKYVIGFFAVLAVMISMISCKMAVEHPENSDKKEYTVNRLWELPTSLEEISGMAWLPNNKLACIEDEDGVIFIYDLKTEKIEEQIKFGTPGDYEGIAVDKEDAYILRSDGVIFQVAQYRSDAIETSHFKTLFTIKNNMESLTMDSKNNRLITITKDRDPYSDDYKGLYQIPLDTKEMDENPILKISMKDDALKEYQKKKAYKSFNPSDVAIHPITRDYYVLEGKTPRLIIMDKTGAIKNFYKLDKKNFPQPEGITFAPDGTLYISTEGKGNHGAILEVTLDK
ncbi:SdiA-regulated domain-containing protein [Nonlabens sp. Asnod2-A12]|uniref:SdiA-regulated domain-containing protein n=1 Tax=Nonlabens sp. Asnod2-A12 TaxID=3160578 RepID=UPI00386ABD43